MGWNILGAIMGASSGIFVVALVLQNLGLGLLPVPLGLGACAGAFVVLLLQGGTR